ncbi:MAG: hypothetical protein ACLSGS_07375 [Adlercreutzia sp.]
MEEKRDTENLIASDTAAAPITPMEEVDVPAAATFLGAAVRSLARRRAWPSRRWAFSCCTGVARLGRRTAAAWD